MFPEAPRWREGRLWFSDFFRERVFSCSLAGDLCGEAHVPGHPSRLGRRPDGSLLVLSMHDQRLLKREGQTRSRLVDLSVLAGGPCNDLLADAEGRAYVGNFGFDLYAKPARHLLDACLSNRRVFVELPDSYPDGLCLDAERAAWWPTRAGAACCACVKIRASYRRYPPASATAMPVCWAVTMAAPCSFAQRPEWARNLSGCSKAALSSPAWTCRTQADPGRASCASKLYPF